MENEEKIQISSTQPQNNRNLTKNDLSIFFNQKQFNIIKTYKKIHRFLFKHGVFVMMCIIAIIITHKLTQQIYKNDSWIDFSTTVQISKTKRNKQISQLNNNYIAINIPYGESSFIDNYHISTSNLGKYQGFIIPRNFQIESWTTLIDIEQFENGEISSGKFIQTAEQLILASSLRSRSITPQIGLPLTNGIIEDFNLQCIKSNRLSNIICDQLLKNFYENWIFYNLWAHRTEITDIMNAVNDKKGICNLMYNNTLYQRNISEIFNTLILQCSTEQIQKYRDLSNFIEVEKELNNGVISSTIYNNRDINTYKLISIHQILYRTIIAGNLNKNYISNYLNYSQELTNRNNGNNRYISPFYKDVMYWINNHILLPQLEGNNQILSKTEINQIINQINLLNKGNIALDVKGLEKQLTTPGLIQQKAIGEVVMNVKDIWELLQPILGLKERLEIRNYTISEDREKVTIQTEIIGENITRILGENLRARIVLFKDKWVLFIESIYILNEKGVNTFLQSYIENNNEISFMGLLTLINENIVFYHEQTIENKTLCNMLTSSFSSNINIILCNEQTIDIFKDGLNFTFTIENETLKEVGISDLTLENQVREELQNSIINNDTTLPIIQWILDKEIEKEEINHIEERLIIYDKIKIYLNIIPTINSGDWKTFEVILPLGEITLKGSYDMETHTISKISFIIPNRENTLQIPNLILPLTEENRENLTYLSNNSNAYLRLFNPTVFNKYESIINQ